MPVFTGDFEHYLYPENSKNKRYKCKCLPVGAHNNKHKTGSGKNREKQIVYRCNDHK